MSKPGEKTGPGAAPTETAGQSPVRPARKTPAEARAERLAAELRANLVRRKEKARSAARREAPHGGRGGDGGPSS